MDPNRLLTSKEISEIVNGFDPIDWVQIDLLAKIPAVSIIVMIG
jgi:hypothetical protein